MHLWFARTLIGLFCVSTLWFGFALRVAQSQSVTSLGAPTASLPNFDIRNESAKTIDDANATQPASPRLVALQSPLSAASKLAPNTIARRFLQTRRDVFQLGDAEINQLTTAREYRDEHNGVTHITLQQAHQGIPLFQGEFTAHIARDGSVMAASATTTANLAAKVNATQPTITAEQAVRVASDYAAVAFTTPVATANARE